MSKRENFYRRDPSKALSGMIGLSLEERGVYNTVLDLLYSTWRPVEDDRRFIANWCGCAVQKLNPIINRLVERGRLITFEEGGRTYLSDEAFEAERNAVKGSAATRSGRAKVGEKSGEVEEKSAGVEQNPPLLDTTTEQKQSVTALEKGREDKKDANASLVAGSDVTKAFTAWNDLAKRLGLPLAKDLTSTRRKAINARLAASGLTGWAEALAAVEASPHCRGENDRGWRADLDFVANPTKFQKLREGSYGLVPSAAASGTASTATFDGPPDLRAAVVRERDEDFARRWLDHYCRWRPGDRTLLAANETVAAALKRDLAAWLTRAQVRVEVAAANTNAPLLDLGAAA